MKEISLVANAAAAGPSDEKESVRLVLPCRDREVSDISGVSCLIGVY